MMNKENNDSTLPLSSVSLEKALEEILKNKDESGRVLSITPKYFLLRKEQMVGWNTWREINGLPAKTAEEIVEDLLGEKNEERYR